jgi:hypothetical protein
MKLHFTHRVYDKTEVFTDSCLESNSDSHVNKNVKFLHFLGNVYCNTDTEA